MHLSGAKLNLQGLEIVVRMVDRSMADLETLHLKNNRLPKEAGMQINLCPLALSRMMER